MYKWKRESLFGYPQQRWIIISEHWIDFNHQEKWGGKKKRHRLKLLGNVARDKFNRKSYSSSAEKMKGCLTVILYDCLVGERNQGCGIHVIFFFFFFGVCTQKLLKQELFKRSFIIYIL